MTRRRCVAAPCRSRRLASARPIHVAECVLGKESQRFPVLGYGAGHIALRVEEDARQVVVGKGEGLVPFDRTPVALDSLVDLRPPAQDVSQVVVGHGERVIDREGLAEGRRGALGLGRGGPCPGRSGTSPVADRVRSPARSGR